MSGIIRQWSGWARVASGRIVEHWGEADAVSMLQQMGIDPFSKEHS